MSPSPILQLLLCFAYRRQWNDRRRHNGLEFASNQSASNPESAKASIVVPRRSRSKRQNRIGQGLLGRYVDRHDFNIRSLGQRCFQLRKGVDPVRKLPFIDDARVLRELVSFGEYGSRFAGTRRSR